jgi:response regulator RpfG family c-di-GMP phosphodiesterase
VKEISPETSRLMLTGHAELSMAIDAVNNGKVFRFLTKPCTAEDLQSAVESGLQQYHLVTAEQDLLEKTLGQSVQLLTEIFSLSTPLAFSRTLRIHTVVQTLARRMNLEDSWQYTVAAMLSQIGCVVLSDALLEKMIQGAILTADEERLFASHPVIGSRLVRNIPRLQVAANMIVDQLKRYDEFGLIVWSKDERDATLGAQLLKAAQDYDQLTQQNISHAEAVDVMKGREGWYNPKVLKALAQEPIQVNKLVFRLVDMQSLDVGMILGEDIISRDGSRLASRYDRITPSFLDSLQLEVEKHGVIEPFRVYAHALVISPVL